MQIEFLAGVAPIVSNPDAAVGFYRDTLGLPLDHLGGGYHASDSIEGSRHFGVWPLAHAAQSCFGTDTWPDHLPTPTVTIEFDLPSPEAVTEAVAELASSGYAPIHDPKVEPWGQSIVRVLGPDGVLIGLTFTPHLRGD